MRRKLPLFAALLVVAAIAVPSALADVWTDQADYTPGSTVTIHGNGYNALEGINIVVNAPYGTVNGATSADLNGAFQWSFALPSDSSAGGNYTYTATGATSGIAQSGSFSDTPQAVQQDVTYDGHGTTNGLCDSFPGDPDLTPGPGQQGWLFILTSPFDGSGSNLTTTFSPSFQTPTNPIAGFKQANGSYHYIVYTWLGAKILSATATNGTQNSQLQVSHCVAGTQLTPDVKTTIVLDSDGTPVTGTPPTVTVGTTVHDTATVTGSAGAPAPTGNVTFTLHNSSDCSGPAVAGQTTTGDLNGSGVASSGTFTPSGPGDWSYSAHYNGDPIYAGADADACEPLHVKTNVAADLTVSKDATPTFDRTYTWGISKKADTDTVYSAGGGESGKVNYTVTVTHDTGTDGNWSVSGDITVTNPNAGDLTSGAQITDAINDPNATCVVQTGSPGNIDPTNALIPGKGSIDFPYTCSYTAAPAASSQTNTATVTWSDQTLSDGSTLAGNTVTGTASIDWTKVIPNIVDGSVTVTDALDGGTPTTLGTVSYTDPSPTTLSDSATFTDPAGTCTSHSNVATLTPDDSLVPVSSDPVKVKDCQGADLTVKKDATPSFTRTYTWGISKKADTDTVYSAGGGKSGQVNYTVTVTHDNGTDSAWQVTGNITVHNPNDWEPITLTDVTDAIDNGGTCLVSGDTGQTIAASGDSTGLTYKCTYSSAPSPASFTNTATATWDATAASTPHDSADGTANGAFDTPSTIVDGSVTVTDALDGGTPTTLGTVSYTDPSPTTLSDSATFTDPAGTCTSHSNVATLTPDDSLVPVSSDPVKVKDCQGADLSVSKTATPTFTRKYKWSIGKAVDKTSVTLIGGGSATFNYTVTASHDSGTDSNFKVTGTVTITNPNDWEAITLTSLSDALDKSGACTFDTAGPYTVPKATDSTHPGSLQVNYTCANALGTDTKNTATANWDSSAAHTPDGSANGGADVAFTTPTTVTDKCANVTDNFDGGGAVTLGTVCVNNSPVASNLNPGHLANFSESYTSPTFTFKYSRTVQAPAAGTCVTKNNTATFTTNDTGTTGNASQSVQVCDYNAPATMGYWKNHAADSKSGTGHPYYDTACPGSTLKYSSCSTNGPFAKQFLPQSLGTFPVSSIVIADGIWGGANCSVNTDQGAIGCLAAQLLAAELNLANKTDPKIQSVVNLANQFLTNPPASSVTYGGYTATSIHYVGPTGTYTLNANQRGLAIALQTALNNYNNGQ
jgi:hypothetical protein